MTRPTPQRDDAARVAWPRAIAGCHWRLVRQCDAQAGGMATLAVAMQTSNPAHGHPTSGGHATRRTRRRAARGTVLIVTLGILIVLAAMVLVLAHSMRVEGLCSANRLSAHQAAAVQDGAVQYVLACVDGLDGGVPEQADLLCDGVQVGDGAFWLLRPDREDDGQFAFGLADEGGKVNLNAVPEAMLDKLKDMTVGLPASIIDWRDEDEEVTAGGAESEYYLMLADPYACKNGPLETVEELLLVQLADTELLFGEDSNRNGVLDENENDADLSDPPDNRDGHLDRGIYDLVTVYSHPVGGQGGGQGEGENEQVNVNQASSQELAGALADGVGEDRLPEILTRARRGRPFQNLFDFYYRTGLTSEEFHAVAGRLTTGGQGGGIGLLNVNTACQEALLCLPELDEADASALVSGRPSSETTEQDTSSDSDDEDDTDADADNLAWIVDVLSQEKAVAIGSYITTKSYQFSADIVAVSGDGRAFRRCRIIVDAAESPPRLIYRQDLTALGWPLSPDILTLLRSGTPMEEVLETTYQEVQ